ncbi:MAG: hypothetical protein GZ087_10370 [Flavobacterium sp.]|nr:hypothetical protein [Flavobacterium sp.]
MIKSFSLLLFICCIFQSYSQKLVYESNGTILNSENQKISPDQVRELLKNNQQLLANYNAGRTKKTIGNVLLYGGMGLFLFNTYYQTLSSNSNYNDTNYDNGSPFALSIVGLASMVVAIPVKIGFSKKIKNVVTEYNNQSAIGYNNPKLDLITNSSGIGLRFILN